jgi:hypothetical protein
VLANGSTMKTLCYLVLIAWWSLSWDASAASYFVDDGVTNGNVYVTGAPSSDTNTGTSASSPKRTITNLLETITLVAGDIVYIDTGVYSNYTVTITNSGTLGNPIIFQGSTNLMAGGTVINRNNTGLDVVGLRGNNLEFRDLVVAGGLRGFNGSLSFPPPTGVVLDRVVVRANNVALARGQWTIRRSILMNNTTLRDAVSSSYDFDQCVFWGNTLDASGSPAAITLNNSVYVGGDLTASMTGDYNVFWNVRLLNLSRAYLIEYGQPNSTYLDPGFADGNASNFYPLSVSGRYNPATGAVVTDAVQSVLIDFGSVASTAWTNEPSPNGSRINAGAFGGTGQASKSRTNAWLLALTFNDGGAITSTLQTLVWNFGGFTSGATVRLQYSPDDGMTWSNITTGLAVTNRSYSWDVSVLPPMAALWRVMADADTNIVSLNRQTFSLGGVRARYYLNDASTNESFYTTAAGSDANDGISPQTPKLTLTNLLAAYTLGRYDIVYVDTGVYSNYTVQVRDYGVTNQPLIFQGAPKAGATVFRRNANAAIFQMVGNNYLLRNLTLEGGGSDGSINDGITTVENSILRSNIVAFRRGTVTVRNSLMFSNTTVIASDTGSFAFDQCVFWRNGQIQSTARPWSVSNSVFVGGTLNGLAQVVGADYCLFWETVISGYPSLFDLQRVTAVSNQWVNSAYLNPLFASPETGDFYPQSVAGRYNPTITNFVVDGVHSPAIDVGDPASTAWTNEASPNGGRLNVGLYGGTSQASKSRTNAWLQAFSLNDGGTLNVPGESVRWALGNLPTGATVRIEFSFNSGFSYNIVATNILASAGFYTITTTNFPSSRFARWRVVLESSPAINSSSLTDFTYRNGPYTYYVNDNSTVGDVYTSTTGNDANLGTTPDAPKASITAVVTNYPLGPGDVVYVDTGVYQPTATIPITLLVSGTNGNPVVIQGSTNVVAGGSILRGQASGGNVVGFTFSSGVQDVDLRDLIIQRRTAGIALSGNTRIGMQRLRLESNLTAGVTASSVSGLRIVNSVLRANVQDGLSLSGNGDATLLHCAVWMNTNNAIVTTGPRVMVTNSVLGARGVWARIYNAPTLTNVIANYNLLRVEGQASLAIMGGIDRELNTLSAWQSESGMDRLSLDTEPQIVNPDGGDFHLRSQTIQGRFDPVLGWVTDTATSPLIDAGNPASDFSLESAPNGGRANIGIYGNTTEASRTDIPRLFAGSLNQGGHVKGSFTLRWVAGALATDVLVRVEFSPNGGESWDILNTGVLASAESFLWSTTNAAAVAGLWRVATLGGPALTSATTNFFGIRNAALTYYVNDGSTLGDQFTVAPGNATNWVATTNRPLNSLALILDRYDIEPGDRIYVDRGSYSLSAPLVIGMRDSGSLTSGVVNILGATTCVGGGAPAAEFTGSGSMSQVGLFLDQARHVVISNLALRQTGTALSIFRGQSLQLGGLRSTQTATNGVLVTLSTNVEFRGALFSGSSSYAWVGRTNTSTRLINTVFISNKFGSVYVSGGTLGVTNSAFVVNESGLAAFTVENSGVVRSDYNNYRVNQLANLASYNGRLHKLPASWQESTTNDFRSLSHDPGFAAADDYHLFSTVGRFDGVTCAVVTDAVHSVMIDAGDPSASIGGEPAPNGGRINIGLYGGGPEASLSSTNGQLLTLSLNSGGTIRGTNILRWAANPAVTGHTVYIDVSFNNGLTWTNIAPSLNASAEAFVWDASPFLSSSLGRWRIGSLVDPSVVATSEVPFTLNNGSIGYYVNDTGTTGDVYCAAAGSIDFDGLSPSTPALSVQDIFARYQPGAGDVIYVDTGSYTFSSTVHMDANNSGVITNPVVIRGSTNWMLGGARINMDRQGPLFNLQNATAITFSDLILTNTRYGFTVQTSSNLVFNRIIVSGANNISDAGNLAAYGFRLDGSAAIQLNRVVVSAVTNRSSSAGILVTQNGSTLPGQLSVNNCILWSNAFGLWAQSAAPVSITNSILLAAGQNATALRFVNTAQLQANFNNYRVEPGARLAELSMVISSNQPPMSMPIYFTTIQAWRDYTGRDTNSLTYDPGFADPAGLDYSLRSSAGRWSPAGLVTDAVSSALLDAGPPSFAFGNEPAPNGSRINMGIDANSDRASLSPTNRGLALLSLHDGGYARGTNVMLRWDSRGNLSGMTIRVELSQNGGQSWQTLATGIPVGSNQYAWNSTEFASGFTYKWRAFSEQDVTALAESERNFAVRNTNFIFYVNDDSTSGDIYTTAAGSLFQSGLATNQPLPSLRDVIEQYDLAAGDVVYVDTGSYSNNGGVVLTPRNQSALSGVITIEGSTNRTAGGSVMQNGGFVIRDARDLVVRNFSVRGAASSGLFIQSSTNILTEWINIAGAGHGIYADRTVNVKMHHALITGSRTNGVEIFGENRRLAFDRGVIWTNQQLAVNPVQAITISNSVLAAAGSDKFIYAGSSNQAFNLNYNFYFLTNGARLARLTFGLEPYPREFANMAAWRNMFLADDQSMIGDPRFADPAHLDFHPLSTGGRWDPVTTNYVLDGSSSPLVDAGSPTASFALEPTPNGSRLNIGLYGNSSEASKSPAAPDYLLLRLNDGGSVSGTNVVLSWVARGAVTGHTARVEFSLDGGASWSVLASNIPPTTNAVSWNTTNFPSTVVGLWRVGSETQTSVVTTASQFFSIRNGPVLFYVNDASMAGDVYTTTNGLSSALGISTSAPIDSLATLISRYDLEPGDAVYMDTGVFTNSATLLIDQLDAGFRLIGSTNTVAGGTRMEFSGTSAGIQILQAPSTTVERITFGPATTAVMVDSSPGTMLRRLNLEGAGVGIQILRTAGITIKNCGIRNSGVGIAASLSSATLDQLVLWSNQQSAVSLSLSSAQMQNCVLGILGSAGSLGIDLDATSTWVSDYNAFYLSGNGVIARRTVSGSALDLRWQRVATWSLDTGNDIHSLAGDPGFADSDNGDFHLRSTAGRFNPLTGLFTTDLTTSALIDAGSPFSAYEAETGPHGRRVNVGMFGNTEEASRSPTNGRLAVARLNDGGRAEGEQVPLSWVAYGAATGHTVRVEVSTNNGASWSLVQSNVQATAETLFWNSQTAASWLGRWRVTSEQAPGISSTNAAMFAVRNQALSLYVNDTSVSNDVFTVAVGDQLNSGTQPSQPRSSVQSLLDDYDLEPGDTIYVDTGQYSLGAPIRIERYDAWNNMANVSPLQSGGSSLRIRGSTRDAPNHTRFVRSGLGNAFELSQALGVHLQGFSVYHDPVGGGVSLDLADSPYALIEECRVVDGSKGANVQRSSGTRMVNLLARNNTQHGVLVGDSAGVDLRQSVLWSNAVGMTVENRGSVTARNNAVVSMAPNSVGWQRNDGPQPERVGILTANYNLLWATNGAFLAEFAGSQYPGGRRRFERLFSWGEASGLDLNSLTTNPQFADPAGQDFHPQSPYGRYVPDTGYITNSGDRFSALIDTGDPSMPYNLENTPNGQRANMGLHGHTGQSSLSPSTGSLQVLTFRDGGSSSGDIALRWAVAGPVASHLLTLQYSNDGGATWTNIATNVAATSESYLWNSVPYGAAAAGSWRIWSQSNTNIVSQNERFFALRQGGSIPYYVNNLSTQGDVYCTSPGSDVNTGYLPSTPKATLQGLLDEVDLEPGDVVYMDTGTYAINVTTLWGELDGGNVTNPVILRGSTNRVAGGTVMDRITGQGSALLLSQVDGVRIDGVSVVNGHYGVSAELSQNIDLRGLLVKGNTLAGIRVAGSSPVTIQNCTIWDNPTNGIVVGLLSVVQQGDTIVQPGSAIVRNNTFWGNKIGIEIQTGGDGDVRNNNFRVNGPDSRVYVLALGQSVSADYNNYFRQNGALMAERYTAFGANDFFPRLQAWQADAGNDLHSLSHDPLVADATSGDFHLRSAAGRVLPSGVVTNDAPGFFSPLIDGGDPLAAWTNEPAPNGQRINIGRYGNTSEASRSNTNGWLLALTLNDGGRVSGSETLRWNAGGWSTNARIRLEIANNGVDYSLIASNLPVYEGSYLWDASGQPNSQLARWRVVDEANPSLSSATLSPFTIKNTNLVVYVNDAVTDGDMYTLAVGSSTNSGRSPSDPLDDPGVALSRYFFSEGDILYIDTGSYTTTNATGMTLGLAGDVLQAGATGNPIRVIGSTNLLSGGTRITTLDRKEYGFRINKTQEIALENLFFSGFTNGVLVNDSENITFSRIACFTNDIGFSIDAVISTRMSRCSAWNNLNYGLSVLGVQSSVDWNQGILWSNNVSAIRHLFGSLSVSNSVLGSASATSTLYEIQSALCINRGDFNVFWANGTNLLINDRVGSVVYSSVRSWQAARHLDTNSFLVDPLFYDPASGDFHLRSDRGRYMPASSSYEVDGITSWAIDAGALGHAYQQEPAPNGGRLNIGLYGNTAQASLSSTNRGLFVVSLRDGGTAASPQPLIWLSRGLSSTDTVRIEYTPNDGLVWEALTTNYPASQGSYAWNNAGITSTPLARWRIMLETNSVISDTSGVFTVRNGPIPYYVNDTNEVGDVYTTTIGSPLNNGITVSTPVHSVSAIIDRFKLEGGDTVYVDTGYYVLTNNIVLRADDSGVVTNRVRIIGSTNTLAGGSHFYRVLDQPWSTDPTNRVAVFEFNRVQDVELAKVVLANGNIGINIDNSPPQENRIYIHDVEVRDAGYYGVRLAGSSGGSILERLLIHRMVGAGLTMAASEATLLSSVIWSNAGGAIQASASTIRMTNTVLHAYGNSVTNGILFTDVTTAFNADYNNYYPQGSASYVIRAGEPIGGLPQWTQLVTQELHSISSDPLFADTTNSDFHTRSPAGRYDPATQTFVTTDLVYSALIDTGHPGYPFTNEPAPNGSRINMGLFGGGNQASKSRSDPWLLAITAMAGGRIGGLFPLHWTYGNLDATNRIALDYSPDAGTNWYPIVSNLLINTDGYLWDSLAAQPFNQSPISKWRVVLMGNTNVWDATDTIFGLNGPFRFYVNDSNTVGDVFTGAPGNDGNLGLSSNTPMATLRRVLDLWDLDPLDFVYIDTGNYLFTTNDLAEVRLNNRGAVDEPVTLLGSPNGSVMDGSSLAIGESVPILIEIGAPYIEVKQVNLRRAIIEAVATNVVIRNMQVEDGHVLLTGRSGLLDYFIVTNGTVYVSGEESIVSRGSIHDGSLTLIGAETLLMNTVVDGSESPLVTIAGTNVSVINNTLVAGQTAIQQLGADSRSFVRNNIIVANGSLGTAFAIDKKGGVVLSDYNLFKLQNGAWFGRAQGGLWERLIYWQQKSGQDTNSISTDPLFANEAGGDYHLRSLGGRYADGVWVTDVVHSAAIDVGAPLDVFTNEPAPNGDRINMGAYGNTDQASRSRFNPWVYAITMNDGGVIRGTETLRWTAGAMDSTNRVILQYSANGGSSWINIVTGLPAFSGEYVWNTLTASNTLDALWRVVLEGDPGVTDQSDSIFNIRNDVRSFYVNDAVTTGDVFTSAPGNDSNDGRTPSTAKATLQNLLATYDTEANDVIYVDTGFYTSSVINVYWSRGGSNNAPLIIRGSTNVNSSGSVLRQSSKNSNLLVLNASYVTVRDMTFENALRGLVLETNNFTRVEEVVARSNLVGIAVIGGGNHSIRSSHAVANEGSGINVQDATQVTVENINFINNQPYSMGISNTVSAVIQNNIFYHDVATSNAQAAIIGNTGTVYTAFLDYNVYYFGDLARSNTTIYATYTNLLRWQRERFKDFRSSITNPAFHSLSSNDFHLRSEAGRYDPATKTFVADTNTSWAIDKGNPYSALVDEPDNNGGRINIGAYGGTRYASKGLTNQIIYNRIANGYLPIAETENPYPLIWHVLNMPFDLTFAVQYSGDGGTEWVTLQSGVPAYQEYIIWTNSPTYNSFNARWRVIGEVGAYTNYSDINDGQMRMYFGGVFRIPSIVPENGMTRLLWRGAWDENYQIQFATNLLYPITYATNVAVTNSYQWQDAILTNLVLGGDTIWRDPGSSNQPHRVYRIIWLGTNGLPYQ